MPTVRRAANADLTAAAETLALAQLDYAWAVWAFPAPDRLHRMRQSFLLDLQLGMEWNSVWVTDDVASVAIWLPPVRSAVDAIVMADVRTAQAALIDVERITAAHVQTQPYHPDVPCWYLGTMGTLPERRRAGLASALMQPVLDECDRTSMLACLETSSDDNVRLYGRLSFTEVVRLHSEDATHLPLIVMERLPRHPQNSKV